MLWVSGGIGADGVCVCVGVEHDGVCAVAPHRVWKQKSPEQTALEESLPLKRHSPSETKQKQPETLFLSDVFWLNGSRFPCRSGSESRLPSVNMCLTSEW